MRSAENRMFRMYFHHEDYLCLLRVESMVNVFLQAVQKRITKVRETVRIMTKQG